MKIDTMNKKIITKILWLTILFLVVAPNYLWAAPEDKEKASDKETDETKIRIQFPGIVVRPRAEFKGDDLRDPFRDYFEEDITPGQVPGQGPAQAPEEKMPSLKVQGIIRGGKFSQAIVNNKIVKIGDTIEGARVISIEKDGVTVFFGHKSYTISSPAAGVLQDLKTKPEGGKDEK
jgi:hypothetical protein